MLALAVLASGFGGGAWAQTPVCSSTPGTGETVFCKETDNGNAIGLDIDGAAISTTADQDAGTGVYGWKAGTGAGNTGDISIKFSNGSITTTGESADGISAWHQGAGGIKIEALKSMFSTGGHGIDAQGKNDVAVHVRDSSITVWRDYAKGVFGQVDGAGDLDIDLRDTDILTSGLEGYGVQGYFLNTGVGKLGIRIEGGSIETSGNAAFGVYAGHEGTGDIDVRISGGASIVTTGGLDSNGVPSVGVFGGHQGDGKIGIRVEGGSKISTSGATAAGIYALQNGTKAVDIDVRDSTVTSNSYRGIFVQRYEGAGDIGIDIRGSTVTSADIGVFGWIRDPTYGEVAGDIDIDVVGSAISTLGETPDGTAVPWAYGVFARRQTGAGAGDGDDAIDIRVQGSTVRTAGSGAYAITAWDQSNPSAEDRHIRIAVRDSIVTTEGDGGRGVNAWRANGAGDIVIDVAGSTVSTSGGTYSNRAPWGISAYHEGTAGSVFINVRDSTVSTGIFDENTFTATGAGAHGIYAYRDAGNSVTRIDVRGSTVTTLGDGAHGIFARDPSGSSVGKRDIHIYVQDSTIATGDLDRNFGAGSHGIHAWRSDTGVGGIGDIVIDVAGSTVKTEGGDHYGGANSVQTQGIYALHEGEGNVIIRVRNGSTVTTAGTADDSHGIFVLTKVAGVGVDITVGAGSVVRVTGERDENHGVNGHGILVNGENGGGPTTVRVGGTVWGGGGLDMAGIQLQNGGTVILGPNARVGSDNTEAGVGSIAIRVSESGKNLKIELRLDPRSLDPKKILAGRVINSGTTVYEVKVNGMSLFDSAAGGATGVWTPIGAHDVRATGTSFATLAFARRIAPRAAVYEALPGVLLRLDDGGGMGAIGGESLLRSADTPIWARIAAGQGSYEPGSATVGAGYDYDRYSVESGMDFALPHEGLTGWAGVRVVSGSAKVSAPTGGGRIEARGYGLMGGVAWEGEDGLYGRGRLSLTRYTADLTSETRGGLKSGVTATVHALDLEGGRRFDLDVAGRKTRLTARGALRRSGLSMGEFDDGLFSRVSVTGADRLAAGAGVAAETGLLPEDGVDRLRLRGSLDAEQVLSGGTKVDVSETELESKAGGTRLGAGFGAAYRFAGYTIGGSAGAAGLGSGDTSYSARLQARIAF